MFTSEETERMREALFQSRQESQRLMTPTGNTEKYIALCASHRIMQRRAVEALASRDRRVTLADALAELDRLTTAQVEAMTP